MGTCEGLGEEDLVLQQAWQVTFPSAAQGCPGAHTERQAALAMPDLFFCSRVTSRATLAPLKVEGPEQGGPSSGSSLGPALAHKQMGRTTVALDGRGLGEAQGTPGA